MTKRKSSPESSKPVFAQVGTIARTSGAHRQTLLRLNRQCVMIEDGHLFTGFGKPLQPLFKYTGPLVAPAPAKLA